MTRYELIPGYDGKYIDLPTNNKKYDEYIDPRNILIYGHVLSDGYGDFDNILSIANSFSSNITQSLVLINVYVVFEAFKDRYVEKRYFEKFKNNLRHKADMFKTQHNNIKFMKLYERSFNQGDNIDSFIKLAIPDIQFTMSIFYLINARPSYYPRSISKTPDNNNGLGQIFLMSEYGYDDREIGHLTIPYLSIKTGIDQTSFTPGLLTKSIFKQINRKPIQIWSEIEHIDKLRCMFNQTFDIGKVIWISAYGPKITEQCVKEYNPNKEITVISLINKHLATVICFLLDFIETIEQDKLADSKLVMVMPKSKGNFQFELKKNVEVYVIGGYDFIAEEQIDSFLNHVTSPVLTTGNFMISKMTEKGKHFVFSFGKSQVSRFALSMIVEAVAMFNAGSNDSELELKKIINEIRENNYDGYSDTIFEDSRKERFCVINEKNSNINKILKAYRTLTSNQLKKFYVKINSLEDTLEELYLWSIYRDGKGFMYNAFLESVISTDDHKELESTYLKNWVATSDSITIYSYITAYYLASLDDEDAKATLDALYTIINENKLTDTTRWKDEPPIYFVKWINIESHLKKSSQSNELINNLYAAITEIKEEIRTEFRVKHMLEARAYELSFLLTNDNKEGLRESINDILINTPQTYNYLFPERSTKSSCIIS